MSRLDHRIEPRRADFRRRTGGGGLAIGVYDALKETGGMWFGWSDDVLPSGTPQISVEERGPVTFATIGLSRRDYDQYYRGFSNATLWPAFGVVA